MSGHAETVLKIVEAFATLPSSLHAHLALQLKTHCRGDADSLAEELSRLGLGPQADFETWVEAE